MKKVLAGDIAELKFANNVKLSPDGKFAAFVQTSSDLKKNGYRNDIFLIDLSDDSVRQLTYNGKNASYIWESNDTLLLMTERTEDDKAEDLEEKTVFYRLNINGGEAAPAFAVAASVQGVWALGAGMFAFKVQTDWNRPDPEKVDKEICEEEKDYHIIEEVPAWGDGRGFISGKRSALFIYDEEKKDLLRVTEKYANVGSVDVRDGKIAYTTRTYDTLITLKNALNVYDVKKKKNTVLVRQNKYAVGAVAWSDAGIYYTACDHKTWGNNELDKIWKIDPAAKKAEIVYDNAEELAIGGIAMSDIFYGGSAVFTAIGKDLYFQAQKTHLNAVYVLKPGKVPVKLAELSGAINGFAADGKKLVFCGSEANDLNALYVHEKETRKICALNTEYLKDRYVAKAEYIPFVNSDGYTVEGWVLKPFGYSAKKKYPALLEIHGGPRAAYGVSFFHEMQQYASDGYFVFFCNPRGSEGYGEEFADLRGKYGTIDFRDLMEFTDHVLKKYKAIDPERVGCLGGSYGGFMCNWIEGHTDRFAAIASQRSVSNWVADFGASEIGITFDSNEMAATPWTDMEKMWEQSPLKYADHASTPILFIHSREDYNCPIDQGMEMFSAMKYFGVPSRMVVFEHESHGLSRIGRPKHRIRRLKEMNDWFRKYLNESLEG